MTPVFGRDVEAAEWIADRTGAEIFPPYTAIWFFQDGTPKAGASFHDYRPGGSVELTLACDGGMRRSMFRAIAAYVFRDLGCKVMLINVKRRNERTIELAKRAGFQYQTTIRDYFGDDSAVMLRMRRSECRWLT